MSELPGNWDEYIPAFCTAHIPEKVLDDFLNQAYSSTEEMGQDPNVIILVTSKDVKSLVSTSDVEQHKAGTFSPVKAFESPFRGWDVTSLVDFVRAHCQKSRLSAENFIVLDERSVQDGTCVLVSFNEEIVKAFDKDDAGFGAVRSEFIRSLSTLIAIQVGAAGADLMTPGQDGVLRNAQLYPGGS